MANFRLSLETLELNLTSERKYLYSLKITDLFDSTAKYLHTLYMRLNTTYFDDIMARTAQVLQRQTVEVLLSDQKVRADQAQSVIPKGYRQATLEEVTLRYRHDADFREELWNKGAACTSQKGLGSSGYQEISEDGKPSSVSENKFYNELTPERRSYHYSGSGSVAVDVNFYGDGVRRLSVYADFRASGVARVAYVKDGHEVATPKSAVEPISKEVVRDAEKQLASLEKSPLINTDQVSAIRTLVDAAKSQKRQ